jgi:hypothetical protein
MSKRAIFLFLAGLNSALAAALLLSAYRLPSAFAQEAPEAEESGLIMVSAKAESTNDAVYLVDTKNHRLHVFRSNVPREAGTPVVIGHIGSRDLRLDLQLRRGAR